MKRLGGRTPHACVSLSPSKIPYVGFSPVRLQTRRQARPSSDDLYAPQAIASPSYGPCGQDVGLGCEGVPVQRPLARQRVLLSRRVIAYYGLIRASRGLLSPYDFDDRSLPRGQSREVPQFTPRVSSLRAISCAPADQAVACDCHFTARAGLRHLCIDSASAVPRAPVPARLCNEAESSSLSLRPDGIASPAPARTFTFELSPPESPR